MAAPTLSLTFTKMQIRVAEYLGVADYSGGAAAVPSDAHDLDLVKRLVNDGYRRFVAEREWRFLVPLSSITLDPTGAGSQCVATTAWRYYMPAGSTGEVIGPVTYSPQATLGARPYLRLVNESIIRKLRSAAETTGDPTLCSIRPLANSEIDSNKTRFEMIFWPTPGSADVAQFRAKLWPDELSSGGDITICGYQHDRTVLAAAIAEAEKQRTGGIAEMEQAYQMALASSIKQDDLTKPRRLGDYGDKSDSYVNPSMIGYNGVSTYNGVDVTELDS